MQRNNTICYDTVIIIIIIRADDVVRRRGYSLAISHFVTVYV